MDQEVINISNFLFKSLIEPSRSAYHDVYISYLTSYPKAFEYAFIRGGR